MNDTTNDNRIVEKIRIVVHTLGPWPNGTMSDNHWSIYLILSDQGSSVRANMTADLEDPTGRLEWSSLAYEKTNSAIEFWDYPVVSRVSVRQIYWLIMEKGRDKYKMSGGGSGCRYWM